MAHDVEPFPLPPAPRDTEPDALKPVLEGLKHVEDRVREHESTISAALSALRTLILQHYSAVQTRADYHARRLQRIETVLSLPPLPEDAAAE